MTMISDTEKLKALAEAATAGPWEQSGIRSKCPENADCIWVLVDGRRVIALPCMVDADYALNFRDAAFIAAANPETVLALIAEFDQLQSELTALKAQVDGTPTHRHKKRFSEYTALGIALVQAASSINENDEVMVYRGTDGGLWVRPVAEFNDGRFEPLTRPTTQPEKEESR